MAAAVSARRPNTNSPHLGGKSMTSSPRSTTRTTLHSAADSKVPTIKQPDEEEKKDIKDIAPPTNAPLAPPPRPTENSDLFKEPNPFENAFGTADTPGKTSLPGVTSLTSPAPLLPGNTPGWPGSLRSGPLSPAMLTGPTGSNDYFNSDHHFAGSFPTPNESSLRTGLTPGGGGSMFPQPSPNSQALYQQLQSGGATPGTLDFHRTAMTARAQTQASHFNPHNAATSQPHSNTNIQPDLDNATAQRHDNQDPFSSHQTNDAANGLYMLAQAGGQRNAQAPYQQQQSQNYAQGMQGGVNDRNTKNSVASNLSGTTENVEGQYSDEADTKPSAKKGKKGSASKAASGSKRKTDETPSRAQNSKKQRSSIGNAPEDDDDEDDLDNEDMDDMNETGADGKKMTDEEKRKNFLERNRIAALKCRQRKKQWLQNLQQKVEIFSTENDALAATVTQLREEIVGLKTLLLAHKDCPVSQAQGITGMTMQHLANDTQGHYANPYGMASHAQMQAGMQRS